MNEPLQRYLSDMTHLVKNQWPLASRVWPGLDYTDVNLLLISVNHKDGQPRYWSLTIHGMRQVTAGELGQVSQPAVDNFAIEKVMGKKGVIITLDSTRPAESPETLFRLATHELVHGWFQPDIASLSPSQSRNSRYPLDYRPRLYRFMVIKNLQQAARQPQETLHLCQARYWFNKWQTEYQEEYQRIKVFDILEGSAFYIEQMIVALKKETNLLQAGASLSSGFNITPAEDLTLDSESYILGDVAGVLLDKRLPQWKSTFYTNQVPPAELLLNTLTDCNIEQVTSAYEGLFQKNVKRENQRLFNDFTIVDEVLNNAGIPLLRLDAAMQQGGFTSKGFYTFKGQDVILAMSAKYSSSAGHLQIMNTNVLDHDTSISVPLPASTELKNDTLVLNTSKLKGEIRVRAERDGKNRIIYVPDNPEAQRQASVLPSPDEPYLSTSFFNHDNPGALHD